jgi:hypothetical protein
MNDEHDADRDDVTPDPDQDARIRALLAELGSGPDGEPIPPEVEARLDDTLAMLVAERGSAGARQDESTSDNVVPLRRRWLPRAAVAAAAVIVLGAGSLAVANLGLMSPGENSSADSAGESAPKATGVAPDSDSQSGSDTGMATVPELSSSSFASDVTSLLEGRATLLTPEREAAGEQSPRKNRDNAKPGAPEALTSQACPGPKITDGAVPNQVRYDGRPAVLLIHPEHAGRQVVDAWNCAGDRKLASTTITP